MKADTIKLAKAIAEITWRAVFSDEHDFVKNKMVELNSLVGDDECLLVQIVQMFEERDLSLYKTIVATLPKSERKDELNAVMNKYYL